MPLRTLNPTATVSGGKENGERRRTIKEGGK